MKWKHSLVEWEGWRCHGGPQQCLLTRESLFVFDPVESSEQKNTRSFELTVLFAPRANKFSRQEGFSAVRIP